MSAPKVDFSELDAMERATKRQQAKSINKFHNERRKTKTKAPSKAEFNAFMNHKFDGEETQAENIFQM